MNSTYRTTAVFRATIACVASLVGASAAHAVEWTGYMRGGPAATSVSGESRQCYGLAIELFQRRLGEGEQSA